MIDNKYDYSIHYKAFHDDTDMHAQAMAQWHAGQLKEHLPLPDEGCRVLDIGCGTGYAMLGMQQLGFKNVEGLDVDQSQVEACLRRRLQVTCSENSFEWLQNRKEHYDVILMLDVLEHMPVAEQIAFMRAVYGCLRPGGRVILTVPNANAMFACRWRYIDYTHYSSFTHYSLVFVLKNAGFSKVEIASDSLLKSRPSLRLWKKESRAQWLRWLVRRLWKKMFEIEISWEDVQAMSFDLNLTAVALKTPAVRNTI